MTNKMIWFWLLLTMDIVNFIALEIREFELLPIIVGIPLFVTLVWLLLQGCGNDQ